MTQDHAVARRTDPGTSWAAAHSIDSDTIRQSQRLVLDLLIYHGPMTDESLVELTNGTLSPSGTRTRRSELVVKGFVFDTGHRVTLRSRRKAIVWAAVPGRVIERQSLWGDS